MPWLLGFYEEIGKVPVAVESRFGHALNPIFEGMFLAAALAVEEGLGTSKEVDDVARRALRLGIGPFTAMNLTGGNPITYEGFAEMHERLHPWFRVPRLLEEAVAEEGPTGRVWDVPARGEEVFVPEKRRKRIEERITAAYLGLAAWTAADERDLGARPGHGVPSGAGGGAPLRAHAEAGGQRGFRNFSPPSGSASPTFSIPPGSRGACASGRPGRSPG